MLCTCPPGKVGCLMTDMTCLCRAGELSETDQAAVRRLVQRAVAHAVATQGQGLSEVGGSGFSWWSRDQGLLPPLG